MLYFALHMLSGANALFPLLRHFPKGGTTVDSIPADSLMGARDLVDGLRGRR